MAKSQRPIITDPNIEVPGTTLEQRLRKYEEEKAEYSRIREEEWITEPSILDSFLHGIENIKKMFLTKKKQQIEKKTTLQKQR